MSGYLSFTTIQRARGLIEALGVRAPLGASSSEVIDLLIRQVRSQRHDPEMRRLFGNLIAELSLSAAFTPERLPAPECEAVKPDSLAEELSWLMEEQPAAQEPSDKPRTVAPLLAAAILLIGLMLGAGCQGDNDQGGNSENSPNVRVGSSVNPVVFISELCSIDLSLDHFNDLILESNDLSADQIDKAGEDYQNLDQEEKQDVITDLCGMSPEQIADYLQSRFPDLNSDDDTFPDDDTYVLYKGVMF